MKNILIPTDLSDSSQNTLKYAINLSVKGNTKLFFYHAATTPVKEVKEYALKLITDIFDELHLDFKNARTEFIIENVHFSNDQIKSAIEKYNIHLVIMGASHEGLRNTFFGSHVSDLINEASCPVLSVPHGYNTLKIESIGYATELFDLSEKLKGIVPFARILGASIEAFHVYPVYPKMIDVESYDIKKLLLQLREKYDYDKINLHFIKSPLDNEPVEGIRHFIKLYKPDMLVMRHKPRGLFDKLLLDTGVTLAVVKSSSISILALSPETSGKII